MMAVEREERRGRREEGGEERERGRCYLAPAATLGRLPETLMLAWVSGVVTTVTMATLLSLSAC